MNLPTACMTSGQRRQGSIVRTGESSRDQPLELASCPVARTTKCTSSGSRIATSPSLCSGSAGSSDASRCTSVASYDATTVCTNTPPPTRSSRRPTLSGPDLVQVRQSPPSHAMEFRNAIGKPLRGPLRTRASSGNQPQVGCSDPVASNHGRRPTARAHRQRRTD